MAKDTGIPFPSASSRVAATRGTVGSGLLEIENRADASNEAGHWGAWWQSFLRGSQLPDPSKVDGLRCIDLFCGSGGFALGASLAARGAGRKARFERIVDADSRALEVHTRSHSVARAINAGVSSLVDYQVKRRGGSARFSYSPEIVDGSFETAADIDLLIAGPPCQGHSNLNNHTRRADARNDLFICTVAVAVALKAKAVVIENVRTVTASHGDVVGMARELFEASGYNVHENIVRADDLGWPQTRERYFMTAIREDLQVVDLREPVKRMPSNVMWAIGDLVEKTDVQEPFDTAPVPGPDNRRRIDWLFRNDRHELVNSERPDCHKDGTTYTAVYGRMYEDRPAPTITTGIGTPGQGRFIHPTQPRLITPHEAARIQGFPDGYGFLDADGTAKRRDLAKWIGDAVPANLGFEVVGQALGAIGLPQISAIEN